MSREMISSSTASATEGDHPVPPAPRAAAGFEHIDAELCRSFERSVELVGRKWTAGILLAGMLGARRFVEYRVHVEGISGRLLTLRLRELELGGLIERHVVPTTPVQITYRPSERGTGLMRALHPLIMWSLVDQDLVDQDLVDRNLVVPPRRPSVSSR